MKFFFCQILFTLIKLVLLKAATMAKEYIQSFILWSLPWKIRKKTKHKKNRFDVSMGSFDVSETSDFVGPYLTKKNVGLYRNHGLSTRSKQTLRSTQSNPISTLVNTTHKTRQEASHALSTRNQTTLYPSLKKYCNQEISSYKKCFDEAKSTYQQKW